MRQPAVQLEFNGNVARLGLDDPERRNALGLEMFDALESALGEVGSSPEVHVLLLHGRGKVFCAGFDLAAAARAPEIVGTFIERLGGLLKALLRLPQVVVGAVHGAAIAGGCALVSACDLVVVCATARLGYPVHRLGLSPAVSIQTLQQAIGPGAARALLLSGQLVDGKTAKQLGLADVLSADDQSLLPDAQGLCATIAGHGPQALRATKAWLNELDGSLDEKRIDGPAAHTAALLRSAEGRAALLAALRKQR